MKFVNTPILIILSGIIGGIAITEFIAPSLLFVIIISILSLSILAIHQFLATKQYIFSNGLPFHTFIASIIVGLLITTLHTPSYKSSHYIHYLNPNEYYTLKARIIEQTSYTNYGTTFKVSLLKANNIKIEGKSLCFFPSKMINNQIKTLQRGDIITFVGKYNLINSHKNPYQFNYKRYMERKGVYGKVNVIHFSIFKNTSKDLDFFAKMEKLRSYLETIIDNHFKQESSALLKTLLLGKRNELNEDTYQNYIDAGAVHILAISGLHIGIITTILLFLLKKMPNIGIYRPLKYTILLLSLWTFAFIAGASPSVLRATIMFSFLGMSTLIRKKQGRFDALIFSMLFLLLIDPFYLYDVGFQLSYIAVFSIMKFYPIIYKSWQPKNKYIRWIWSLFLVGLSAQIIVLPISLYYFHQFPILFFLSNLLVVPLLQPILIGGIIMLLLGTLNILPNLIILFLEQLINIMNFLVKLIADQENFIVRNISFSTPLLFTSLLAIILIIVFLHYRKTKVLIAIFITIFIFQGILFYNKYHLETTQEMLVFDKYKEKIITIRQGKNLTIYQYDTININPLVINYIKNKGISDIKIKPIPYLLHFNKKNYLLIDSLGVYPKSKQVVIDSVIFLQTPKINIDRMKKDLLLRY